MCVCVCEKFSEWIEINWPFGRLFFSPILLLYTYVIEIMLVVVCCLLSIDDCSIFFDEGDGVWLLVVVLFQMCQSMWSLCMCVIENKIEIEIQFMFLQIFNYSFCCCCRFHISFVIVVLYYCLIWLSCFFYTTSGLYYQAFFLVIYLLKLDFFSFLDITFSMIWCNHQIIELIRKELTSTYTLFVDVIIWQTNISNICKNMCMLFIQCIHHTHTNRYTRIISKSQYRWSSIVWHHPIRSINKHTIQWNKKKIFFFGLLHYYNIYRHKSIKICIVFISFFC